MRHVYLVFLFDPVQTLRASFDLPRISCSRFSGKLHFQHLQVIAAFAQISLMIVQAQIALNAPCYTHDILRTAGCACFAAAVHWDIEAIICRTGLDHC